jgi:TolB-like protein/Tfp pilus assembly protein PilF
MDVRLVRSPHPWRSFRGGAPAPTAAPERRFLVASSSPAEAIRALLREARRRKVFRAVAAYSVAVVAVIAVASDLFPALRLPEWSVTLVAALGIAGLPLVIALAWSLDWAPEGIRREQPPMRVVTHAPRPAESSAVEGLSGRERTGIAVLPFANLSPDPNNEFFADGITEDVIAQLSKIAGLRVISRTSVLRYRGSHEDSRTIGERLGVSTLLEGSVRREGDRIRLVVQLIDAIGDEHLWAETYDRELTDVFSIQSELALGVAGSLRTRLTSKERARVNSSPTADTEAYTLYLRGRQALSVRTGESLGRARELFGAALERDASYAAPHAGLAELYALLGMGFGRAPEQSLQKARAAAARAIELDPDLAEAHAALGWVRTHDWDWWGAEASLRRAVELNPSYAQGYEWYGYLCAATRRYPEALHAFQTALDLDPLSPLIQTEVGWPHGYMGRWREAIHEFEKAIDLDPDFAMAHMDLAWIALLKSEHDEAIRLFRKAEQMDPLSPYISGYLARAYALAGREDDARQILDRLKNGAEEGSDLSAWVAYVLEGLGDTTGAFDWLERGFRRHESPMFLLGVENVFNFSPSFRKDPDFARILSRMGLPPEGPLYPRDDARTSSPPAAAQRS